MTVVLAVSCADGCVIGSDSQITNDDHEMSYPAQKLHPLGSHAAWGGSGARSVLLELEELLPEEAGSILESPNISRALQERVLPVLRYHYEHFIPEVPGSETLGSPAAYVLAAGYSSHGPWITKINPNGMVTSHEDVGFHAIGGGAPMAQQGSALLGHFRVNRRDVRYGVLTVVRTLRALDQSVPSVGAPFSVCRITEDGAHHLDDEEIEETLEQVVHWTELEEKVLDDLFP